MKCERGCRPTIVWSGGERRERIFHDHDVGVSESPGHAGTLASGIFRGEIS